MKTFTTNYSEVLAQIERIDVVAYSKTRNYLNGAVSYLSPYIARGVITLPQILKSILAKNSFHQSLKFIQELAWREYWQRVWWARQDAIFNDLKNAQSEVQFYQVPTSLVNGSSGITAIDSAIKEMYLTGYMHNHARMYTASVVCNISKAHWLPAAKWMYYHLIDGDIASNFLSWQWVAGTNSSKQYFCNQENINRYFNTKQQNTFLDFSYEDLPAQGVPEHLAFGEKLDLKTNLPQENEIAIDVTKPTYVYTTYNLNPKWDVGVDVNRILILEPTHFEKFPISSNVLQFCLELAKNVSGIQVFVGEFAQLKQQVGNGEIIFMEHPTSQHFVGKATPYPWLIENDKLPLQSFFAFWKKIEKQLQSKFQ